MRLPSQEPQVHMLVIEGTASNRITNVVSHIKTVVMLPTPTGGACGARAGHHLHVSQEGIINDAGKSRRSLYF